jgi:hypothetical protein
VRPRGPWDARHLERSGRAGLGGRAAAVDVAVIARASSLTGDVIGAQVVRDAYVRGWRVVTDKAGRSVGGRSAWTRTRCRSPRGVSARLFGFRWHFRWILGGARHVEAGV